MSTSEKKDAIVWEAKVECFGSLVGFYGPLTGYDKLLVTDTGGLIVGGTLELPGILGCSARECMLARQKDYLAYGWTFAELLKRLKQDVGVLARPPLYENGSIYVVGTFRGHVFSLYDRGFQRLHVATDVSPWKQDDFDRWMTDLCAVLSKRLMGVQVQ